jgi:thiol-disulfide isomerase/thioredoxin
MVKHIILLLLLVFTNIGFSQTITMDFPAFSGKTYDFVIFQGSKAEKVIQDTIPKNGKFRLTIPPQYAPYTGMCRWLLTNSEHGGGIDMAIPGHDFSIVCQSDKPDNTNILYTGFDAVNELNRINGLQQKIIDKFETMSNATKLYDITHPLFAAFQKEKEVQAKAYEDFQADLKKNSNYNARFLPIVNLVSGTPHRLTDDYNEKALLTNEFITQKMSIEDLWVSGHWEGIIQSWVMLQINVVNDKTKFKQDFKLISDRIKNPIHYTAFVGKLTFFLTQYGKDDYIDAIAHMVLSSGKVSEYLGSMQVYLKSMVGIQAPDLVITEHIGKIEEHRHQTTIVKSSDFAEEAFDKTLLVFYKSGCGPCEETMQALQGNYMDLQKKGFKIISIAADTDEHVFKNTSSQFPWEAKYCDFEGTNGINFKNYAVIGTPTMYILDKQGTIIKKLATVQELLNQF